MKTFGVVGEENKKSTLLNKGTGNNKITELQTILQRESKNS